MLSGSYPPLLCRFINLAKFRVFCSNHAEVCTNFCDYYSCYIFVFRMYDIRWQYCGLHDIFSLCLLVSAQVLFIQIGTLILFGNLPISLYMVEPIIEIALIGVSRVAYKLYLEERN